MTRFETKLTTAAAKNTVDCKTHDNETTPDTNEAATIWAEKFKTTYNKQQAKVKGPAAWAKPYDILTEYNINSLIQANNYQ